MLLKTQRYLNKNIIIIPQDLYVNVYFRLVCICKFIKAYNILGLEGTAIHKGNHSEGTHHILLSSCLLSCTSNGNSVLISFLSIADLQRAEI